MSGDAFKSTIVEEVEMLSREPKLGLFPADFDEEVWVIVAILLQFI